MRSKKTVLERFNEKVFVPFGSPVDNCHIWMAAKKKKEGYGKLNNGIDTNWILAHRVSYELFVGPIPAGLHVLHACDTPACVNPAHLFLGTQADNMRDMKAKGRSKAGQYNAAKTHCPQGHEYTPENTLPLKPGQGRKCRACAYKKKAS